MASTIQIPIPEALARVYDQASEEERTKVAWLVELVLHDMFDDQGASLRDVIHDISQRAGERGMTQDILDELLKDDE